MIKTTNFLIALALMLPATGARADDCQFLGAWLNAQKAVATPDLDISDRARLQGVEWNQRQEAAETVYESYLSGKLQPATLQTCLAGNTAQRNFLNSVYTVFYEKSMQRLRNSKSPAVRRLVAEFDRKNGASLPIFRVMGYEEQTPTPLPGGYQRAIHSIYLNFGMVRPNDWLLLFVHEILHSVDEQLWSGVEKYSKPDQVKTFATLANQKSSFSQLSFFQKRDMKNWIMAGLDRGLLAEYRAWSATFEIYGEGLSEGLWQPIDWVEAVLAPRPKNSSIEAFTLSYLDQHSPDPSDGIFSKPLLQSSLKEVRSELRSSPTPPSLANLGGIVHDR